MLVEVMHAAGTYYPSLNSFRQREDRTSYFDTLAHLLPQLLAREVQIIYITNTMPEEPSHYIHPPLAEANACDPILNRLHPEQRHRVIVLPDVSDVDDRVANAAEAYEFATVLAHRQVVVIGAYTDACVAAQADHLRTQHPDKQIGIDERLSIAFNGKVEMPGCFKQVGKVSLTELLSLTANEYACSQTYAFVPT